MDIDEYLESLMKTEKASKFPLSMYYSEGCKYLKLFQYEKAFQFLNEAVVRDPTSIHTLLKRSKCYIGLQEYKKAIGDADKVLQLCPNNVHAVDLKGEAQYLMGDFEGGYLTYLEGRKTSPANEVLRLGAQLCQDALDNSLHPRLGVKYQKGDVVNVLKSEKRCEKFQNRLKYRKSARDCFRRDAKFLEDLIIDENLKSVHGFCREALDYIRHHERFWGMETPMHSRKRCQETKVKEIKKPQTFETNIRLCNAAKRRAEFMLKKRKADDCISEAINLLNLAESLHKEREREKMKFKCDAFHLLALAYRQLKMVSRAFRYLSEELKISTKFNFTLQETKAYHQLGVIYRNAGDITGTMQCLNKIIEAMDPENVDELLPEKASPEDIRQVQEINEWMENVISEIQKPPESENIRLCKEAKRKAESALQKGNTADCISEASNLLNLTSSLLSKEHRNEKMKLKCDGYHLLGLAYKQKKNFHRAFDFFFKELEITEKFKFTLPQTKAYHQLGLMYHLTGNIEGTTQCLKKIIEAMSPGKVDELIPDNASIEEIKQIREIDEWAKSMISKFKMIRQEPYEPVKELENESIVQDILRKLTKSVATKDPVQLLQYSKTKDDEFISNAVIGNKTGLSKPEEVKKTYESRRERESKGLVDKSSIEETLEELTRRIEFEDLIQQVHSIKDKYKREEFIPCTDMNEHTLEELAESVATKDAVQPAQFSLKKQDEFMPIPVIGSKTDLHKSEEVKKTYESRRERESKGLVDKSSIEETLEELTGRIEFEDLIQQVQSIKEKYKSEEFIPSTTIIEHTLEELADSISTKDPVVKGKTKEYIPSTVIDSKDELDKLKGIKQVHESRKVKMSERLDYKSAVEDILKNLTEHIEEVEDPLQLIKSVKRKSTSEKFLPTSVSDIKGKLKEIKETYESSTEKKSEGSDKSSIKEISTLVLETLTEHVAVEDTVQYIQPVKVKSKSKEFFPTSIIDSKNELEKIKPSESSIETKSEGLDDTYSIEDILTKITKSVAVEDPLQSIPPAKEKSKSKEFIPTIISDGKDEPGKFKEIKETCESSKETESKGFEDKSSIEDILKKITKYITMEDPVQSILPAKEKSKSGQFIPTIISDEKEEPGKFKNIKEIRELSRERESEDSEDESVIDDISEKSTESLNNESIVAGTLKELTESIVMEYPAQLVHPVKEESKTEKLFPIAIIDRKDDLSKSKELEETFEPRTEKKPGSFDGKFSIEAILQKVTESVAMKDLEQLAHSVKEKGKTKELISIKIVDSKEKSGKPEEFKGSYESNKERDLKSLDDKSSIKDILKKLNEQIETEDPVQPIYSIKGEMREVIPATIFDRKNEIDMLEKVNEIHETSRKDKSKDIEDEGVIEEISEEPTLSIEAEDSLKLVQSIKEKEKAEELIPGTTIDGKDESEKLEEKKEVGESSRETFSGDSDEESIAEEISEDFTDEESIIENTLIELTQSIASKQPVQLIKSVKGIRMPKELIPTATIERKRESDEFKEVKETHKSRAERESEDLDEESITEEILEDLTDDKSIIEDTLMELTESIASKQPVQPVKSAKEKSITKEFIPTTIIERKKDLDELKEVKETRKFSTEKESEDLDEESITEEISEDLTDDESIIEDTLKGLTESIASKQPVQLVQSVKEKSVSDKLIPTIERRKESAELIEMKKMRESSIERKSEDSDDESVIEEILEDSDDESVIEEILEDLTGSIAIEDVEQQIKPRMETKFEELDDLTKFRPKERASELYKPVKMEKSPVSTKQTEKSDNSVTHSLTKDRKESSKSEKIKKVEKSTKQTEKSDDLRTYGLSEDKNKPRSFEGYNIRQISKPIRKQKKMNNLEADFVVEYEDTPITCKRTKQPKRSKEKSNDEEKSEKVTASNVAEDDKEREISREERTSEDTKTKFIKKDDDDDSENDYS